MSTQLLDDKKSPFPTYAKVPGGTGDDFPFLHR
jgi:hypothetical protein